MSKGLLYIDFFYPGYIGLIENSSYLLYVNDVPATVQIYKHLRPLKILDFRNGIDILPPDDQKQKTLFRLRNTVESLGEDLAFVHPLEKKDFTDISTEDVRLVVDISRHYHRSFRPRPFTEVMICYEIENTELVADENRAFSKKVLLEFLRAYRYLTHDVKVRLPQDLRADLPILKECAVAYTKDEENRGNFEECITTPRRLSFALRQLDIREYADCFSVVEHDEIDASRNLQELFSKRSSIPIVRDALTKAFEELKINHNARYALLDTFIAAESLVSDYLYKIKLSKGASKGKLDEYKSEVSISYMLNVEVPIFLGAITEQERKILSDVDRVRRLRNGVVHEGKNVSEEEALSAINAVSNLVKMIEQRQAS